jgi:peptidoglycan/LPS O-acetylase OafA/YrhL
MNSLRALAALAVVVFHLRFYAHLPSVARYGDAGVTIFFLLSAFLLYRPLARVHLDGGKPQPIRTYARRRVLRIVPAYWVVLTIGAVLLSQRYVFGPKGLLYYGFLQIYHRDTLFGGLSVAWTLCIEVTLYAFLPLWAWLMRRLPARARQRVLIVELLGCVLLIVLSTVWKKTVLGPEHFLTGSGPWFYFALPSYLDQFAIGMALAVLSVWWEGKPLPTPLRPLNRFPGLSWVLAGVALWATTDTVGGSGLLGATLPTDLGQQWLYAAIALFLILPCVFGDQQRGLLRKTLGLRPILWIGLVSYAVYLWHTLVLHYLSKWDIPGTVARALHISPALIWIPFGIGATLVVAALSWHLVEQPALRFAHRPAGALKAAAARYAKPAGRALGAGFGLALAAAGIIGVGYVVCDVALVISGAILVAFAVGWRPKFVPLTAATAVLAVVSAAAAVVPMLLEPLPAAASSRHRNTPPAQQGAARQRTLASPTHLVLTFDGNTVRIYVNGSLSMFRAAHGPADVGAKTMEIGGYLARGLWNGAIANLALYRSALPSSTVAKHYGLGATPGGAYVPAVRATPGLVNYWPLDSPVKVHDAVGHSVARVSAQGVASWYALVGGRGKSIALNGLGGELRVHGVTPLPGPFSVEVWVLPGPHTSDRTIVSRPGGWFVKTDILGHWSGGFFHRGRIQSVTSPVAAGSHPGQGGPGKPAAPPPPRPISDAATSELVLLVVAAMAVTSLPRLRRERKRTTGQVSSV